MTRKQMGIILTLMALIVCVGVLSMKLNENGLLDQQVGLESVLEKNDDSTKETLSTKVSSTESPNGELIYFEHNAFFLSKLQVFDTKFAESEIENRFIF